MRSKFGEVDVQGWPELAFLTMGHRNWSLWEAKEFS